MSVNILHKFIRAQDAFSGLTLTKEESEIVLGCLLACRQMSIYNWNLVRRLARKSKSYPCSFPIDLEDCGRATDKLEGREESKP